jgi:hypothetical protein
LHHATETKNPKASALGFACKQIPGRGLRRLTADNSNDRDQDHAVDPIGQEWDVNSLCFSSVDKRIPDRA